MEPKYTIIKTTSWYNKNDMGRFVWSRYWHEWDQIVAVDDAGITVRDVKTEQMRRHCTYLERGDIISDKVFEVERKHLI